jgi:hypothetical protein
MVARMDMPPHACGVSIGRGHRFAAYPRCSADLTGGVMLSMIVAVALQMAGADQALTRSCYVRGQRWDFAVTRADLARAPVWSPTKPFPPFSPRGAISIARQQLKALVEDSERWPFLSVSLYPISGTDHWMYVVDYAEPISPETGRVGVAGARLGLVVLMDGNAITPTREPWPPR